MVAKNNLEKSKQLGIPYGTAANRLRKQILFSLVQETSKDICFQCNKRILNVDDFSIEHKEAWLYSDKPSELYFDLNNISFSHLRCNIKSRRIPNKGNKAPHGTNSRYSKPHNCRCDKCKRAQANYRAKYRKRTGKR